MLRTETSARVSALYLLVGATASIPGPRGRSLIRVIDYLKDVMAVPKNDPLLPVMMEKLTSIEASIEKLAAHVAVQNGRIGKLEQAHEADLAIEEHIREDVAALDRADERRFRRVSALISIFAALFGGAMAVVIDRVFSL